MYTFITKHILDDVVSEIPLDKNIHTHHPGNPLGMYWKRIKPSKLAGFNTFPSAYPIDSQVVGMYVFVQCPVWLQKAEGHGGYGLCYQAAQGKMCRAAPRPPPALHRSHQGIRHCEPSCTLGDTQQAWMPTSICTDHPLLPWWHVLQGHSKWWRLWPISSVKWSEARLCACANAVQSPLRSDALCSSLRNWDRIQKFTTALMAISSTTAAWSPTPKWLGPLCETSSLQMIAHLRLTPR